MSDRLKHMKWDDLPGNTWQVWVNYVRTKSGHIYRARACRSRSMSDVQAILIKKSGIWDGDGSQVVYRIHIKRIVNRDPNIRWYLPEFR